MRLVLCGLCWLGVAMAVSACGGKSDSDDGGSSGSSGTGSPGSTSVDTGLPEEKQISELTPAETQELTTNFATSIASEDFLEELQEPACRFGGFAAAQAGAFLQPGVTDADLQQQCQQAYDQCIAQPIQGLDTSQLGATPVPIPTEAFETAGCEITVGEFEACMASALDITIQLFASAPGCSEVTTESVSDPTAGIDFTDFQVPTACATLGLKCPTVFGETPEM